MFLRLVRSEPLVDGSRFDEITRTLATSRRGVLRTLFRATGASVAAVLGRCALENPAGLAQEGADERRNPFYRAGRRVGFNITE
jgi:hypothetical protein